MHGLIIEDEILLAFGVQVALEDFGYSTVDIAASVTEAIDAAKKRCPDLIVADHRIVDGTGTAAVQSICADKAIPVVFVTSSEDEVREQLPEAIIVPKPFSLPDLQAAIASGLERPFRHLQD